MNANLTVFILVREAVVKKRFSAKGKSQFFEQNKHKKYSHANDHKTHNVNIEKSMLIKRKAELMQSSEPNRGELYIDTVTICHNFFFGLNYRVR